MPEALISDQPKPEPEPIKWKPADLASLEIRTYDLRVVAKASGIDLWDTKRHDHPR